MSPTLQVALTIASFAFIALVLCIVPIALEMRRHLEHLARSSDQLQGRIEILLNDSRELLQKLNALSQWANDQQMDISHVVHTVKQWTDQGDRLVNTLGTVVDPPLVRVAENLNLLRVGVTGFLKVLTHEHHQPHGRKGNSND